MNNSVRPILSHHPTLEKVLQDAMQAISVQANDILVEHVDFSPFKHLVDVGGGKWYQCHTDRNSGPFLKPTIFDSAATVYRIADLSF